MRKLVRKKYSQSAQEALIKLESAELNLEKFDMSSFAFIETYKVKKDDYTIEYITPGMIGKWPVFSLIHSEESAILLYTKQMTLLDGYDPQGGRTSKPLIDESVLDECKLSFQKF